MKLVTEKQLEEFRSAFVRNLTLDFFDEGEIKALLAEIDAFDPAVRQKVLALCLALSNASSSLVPRVLSRITAVSKTLSPEDLDQWVNDAFDALDSQGIDAALSFLARAGETEGEEFRAPRGLRLREISRLLETFLRGLSGIDLKLEQGPEVYTDTVTILLPPVLAPFDDREGNFLLYKLALAHQWARIACGTLLVRPDSGIAGRFLAGGEAAPRDLDGLFRSRQDRGFALDLYNALESIRLDGFLRRELPGLMRRAGRVLQALFDERPALGDLGPREAAVEALFQFCLGAALKGAAPGEVSAILPELSKLAEAAGPDRSLHLAFRISEDMAGSPGPYLSPAPPLPFGRIRPDKVSRALEEIKRGRKEKLEAMLAEIINLPELEFPRREFRGEGRPAEQLPPNREYLLLRGRLVEVDDDLREVIEERGGAPAGLLVQGSDIGSGTVIPIEDLLEESAAADELPSAGGILYDEWDYQRGGFRKNWCSLHEQDVPPGRDPFVELTLSRYGGAVGVLRKKFELLRRVPKILRGQKEGDDIDLDAMVEAFADSTAGLAPGERLFSRLDRAERNISVLFLIDMSGSTKGWVNQAEKESLVLLAEALEALGDRYAIYGFSGMTRTRCDLFRVKSFDEPYGESVRRRIAGITPKDYTRMGAFIRHGTALLQGTAARTRLLITLSDGKPEDWDAYKGAYGIEDTRHALIESRQQGVHPFCITIDKEAQTYLPHLYGETNYIFIDDVRKLPARITEIYRRLTT